MSKEEKENILFFIISLFLSASIFIWDLYSPPGLIVWMFYIFPIFFVLKMSDFFAIAAMFVISILVVAGLFEPMPFRFPVWIAIYNRLMGLGAGWIMTASLLYLKKLKNLAESYSKSFLDLIDKNPDGVVVIDKKGKVLFVNSTIDYIAGRKGSDFVGQVLGIPLAKKESTEINVVLRSGEPRIAEIRVVASMWRGQPVDILFLRDITKRKLAEKEIEHLASFPEFNPNPVLEAESLKKISYANPAALKVLREMGFNDSELSVLLPGGAEKILGNLQGKSAQILEREIAIKDRWFIVTVNVLPRFGTARFYLKDITGSKRAIEELHRSQSNLRRAQEVGQIGSWRLDIKKNELVWSEENYRIFGIKKGTPLTYESFLSIVHPDDRAFVDSKWKTGLSGQDYDIDHRIIVDGRTKWVREKAFLEFDKTGKVTGGFGIAQDITQRKQAEDILKRDKKTLEALVEEKTRHALQMQRETEKVKRLSDLGVLAATVAHELRNPLAAISLASVNIRHKVRDHGLDLHFNNIQKKIIEGDKIIDNLLAYSKIRPPKPEKINIIHLINDCIEAALKQTGKSPEIHREYPDENLMIEADPLQLKEVFSNLLNNAMDALADEGGAISIRNRIEGDHVRFSIEDNGEGIPAGIIEKVFDPFFSTKAKGTGLGLSVCKQIIEFHRGTISIQSEPKKGTVVNVWLPIKNDYTDNKNASIGVI